jgi:hypothetical protein
MGNLFSSAEKIIDTCTWRDVWECDVTLYLCGEEEGEILLPIYNTKPVEYWEDPEDPMSIYYATHDLTI